MRIFIIASLNLSLARLFASFSSSSLRLNHLYLNFAKNVFDTITDFPPGPRCHPLLNMQYDWCLKNSPKIIEKS